MKKITLIFVIILSGCVTKNETVFSEKSLKDTVISLDEKSIKFKEILDQYKGKKILINAWASWCGDCIRSLPNIKEVQKNNPDVVFVFLSLDKSVIKWKKGITRVGVIGNHYFMESGWDSKLSEFLSLKWIPRYLVVDKEGGIEVFNATKISDKRVVEALKSTK